MLNRLIAPAMVAALAAAGPAAADDFYEGQTISLYIGFGAGGNYDLYARVLARHMGRHIPGNPEIVPVNMTGAGSMLLTNWLHNVAPRDGTAFGTISRAVPFYPLIGDDPSLAQFDPTGFTWIGSANDEVSTCVAWADSGITSVDDLFERGMVMGGDGPTADGEQYARVMNGVLGTQIEIVSGYEGGNAINLAVERGEVEGRCGWSWSSIVATRPDWLEENRIVVLMQMGSQPHPDLPDVPQLSDFVEDEQDRAIVDLILARQPLGRPFVAPPGIPEDRAEILRTAFLATMEDPEFIAEAERAGLELNTLSGEEVEAIIRRVFANASDDLVRRVRDLLAP